MNRILIIILTAIATILPIILIKKYIETKQYKYLILTLLLYIPEIYMYIILFKHDNFATLYGVVKILAVLIVIVIAIFFYNETVTKKKMIGLIIGLVAIFLLI